MITGTKASFDVFYEIQQKSNNSHMIKSPTLAHLTDWWYTITRSELRPNLNSHKMLVINC